MTEQSPKPRFELVPPESDILNQKSVPVPLEEISTPETQAVIDSMLSMASGEVDGRRMIGLAAPQLGILKQIVLVDTAVSEERLGDSKREIFINPKIVSKSREAEDGREGCFSTGCVCGIVARSKSVTISAYNRDGEVFQKTFEGFTARIFQHEIDHLDGKRFPDLIEDPKKLHWVESDEYPEYRKNWENWPKKCPKVTWDLIKLGT